MNINSILNSLITPFTGVITAGAAAITKALQWFTVNPLYTLIGFYVFMMAVKGGNVKVGKAVQSEVKK